MRILVHIHVYYPQFWPELKEALSTLSAHQWDLWITMVEEHEAIVREARQLRPEAHIEIVENRGYDVAPFLHVLRQVNLEDYDFCLKLHTKRNFLDDLWRYDYRSKGVPYRRNGPHWRESLLSFLKPEHFQKCMRAFRRDAKLGMVGDHRFILRRGIGAECIATGGAQEMLERLGLPSKRVEWVSGTMFLCRAQLLEPLKRLNYRAADFALPDENHTISLPHMIETCLGGLMVAQGYTLRDVYTPYYRRVLRFVSAYMQILVICHMRFLRVKRTKSNRLLVKFCKIPVYAKKLPME